MPDWNPPFPTLLLQQEQGYWFLTLENETIDALEAAADCPWSDQFGNLWWVTKVGAESKSFEKSVSIGYVPYPILKSYDALEAYLQTADKKSSSELLLGFAIMFNQNIEAARTLDINPWTSPVSDKSLADIQAKKATGAEIVQQAAKNKIAAMQNKLSKESPKLVVGKHVFDVLVDESIGDKDFYIVQPDKAKPILPGNGVVGTTAKDDSLSDPKHIMELINKAKEELLNPGPVSPIDYGKLEGYLSTLSEEQKEEVAKKSKEFSLGKMYGMGKFAPVGYPLSVPVNEYAAKDVDKTIDISQSLAQTMMHNPTIQYLAGEDAVAFLNSPTTLPESLDAVDQFGGIWVIRHKSMLPKEKVEEGRVVKGHENHFAFYTKKKVSIKALESTEADEAEEDAEDDEPEAKESNTMKAEQAAMHLGETILEEDDLIKIYGKKLSEKAFGPVPIECEHGFDVCPICDSVEDTEPFDLIPVSYYEGSLGQYQKLDDKPGCLTHEAISDEEYNPAITCFMEIVSACDPSLKQGNPAVYVQVHPFTPGSFLAQLIDEHGSTLKWEDVDSSLLCSVGDRISEVMGMNEFDVTVVFGKLSGSNLVVVGVISGDTEVAFDGYLHAYGQNQPYPKHSKSDFEGFGWQYVVNRISGFTVKSPEQIIGASPDVLTEWADLTKKLVDAIHADGVKQAYQHKFAYKDEENPLVVIENVLNKGWAVDLTLEEMLFLTHTAQEVCKDIKCVLFGQAESGVMVAAPLGEKGAYWISKNIETTC